MTLDQAPLRIKFAQPTGFSQRYKITLPVTIESQRGRLGRDVEGHAAHFFHIVVIDHHSRNTIRLEHKQMVVHLIPGQSPDGPIRSTRSNHLPYFSVALDFLHQARLGHRHINHAVE